MSFRLKISQQSQSIDLSVEQLDSARNVDLAWLKHQKKGDCGNGHDSFAKRWGNSSQYLAMLRGTSWRMLMEPAKMRRFTKDFGNLTQEGCWVWSYYVVQRWPSHPQATSFDPLSKLCGKHWPLFKGGVQDGSRGGEGTWGYYFFGAALGRHELFLAKSKCCTDTHGDCIVVAAPEHTETLRCIW